MKDIISFPYSKTKGYVFLLKGKITIILRVYLQYYFKHKHSLEFWASFPCIFRSRLSSFSSSSGLAYRDGINNFFSSCFQIGFVKENREGSHAGDKRERVMSAYLFFWLLPFIVSLCWLLCPYQHISA